MLSGTGAGVDVQTDPEAPAAIRERGLPEGETVVEIPKALLAFATQPATV